MPSETGRNERRTWGKLPTAFFHHWVNICRKVVTEPVSWVLLEPDWRVSNYGYLTWSANNCRVYLSFHWKDFPKNSHLVNYKYSLQTKKEIFITIYKNYSKVTSTIFYLLECDLSSIWKDFLVIHCIGYIMLIQKIVSYFFIDQHKDHYLRKKLSFLLEIPLHFRNLLLIYDCNPAHIPHETCQIYSDHKKIKDTLLED